MGSREEKVSELEDTAIGKIQNETEKEKKTEKKKKGIELWLWENFEA
jgi:hypothetical protein